MFTLTQIFQSFYHAHCKVRAPFAKLCDLQNQAHDKQLLCWDAY